MPRRSILSVVLAGVLVGVAPMASAEALPGLAMLGLIYSGAKGRVGDDEALQEQMNDVDIKLRQGYQSGRTGEIRRQLLRGLSLGFRREWNDQLDFDSSLVARTDNAFVDPSRPIMVRLSQIYPSVLIRTDKVSGRIELREPGQGFGGQQLGAKLRDLVALPEVSLDLIESPVINEIDLADVDDGDYDIRFEILDGDDSLGSATLRVHVRRGLDDQVAGLRTSARGANDELRPDILYPLDYMRKVNAGLVDANRFDVDVELAAAERVASSVAEGKDPFAKRTGDFERHYLLADAGEIMPYRVYIPKDYPARGDYPLVVALHGLGGNEDDMFGEFYGIKELAEARGYIVVSPMGYRSDGGYGASMFSQSRSGALSEQDVMEVLARTRRDYAIDAQRIYLMGHSMGGIGTWNLGATYPDIWAGLAPIAGMGNPATAEKMRHIPQIVVHGDADSTVPVTGSRSMVEALKKLDAEVNYIEVPGGNHTDIAPANMSNIFDFFDAHTRPAG